MKIELSDMEQVTPEPDGSFRFKYTPPPTPEPITYTNGKRLTWNIGNTRIELLSNLPEAELFKIAEAMTAEEQ